MLLKRKTLTKDDQRLSQVRDKSWAVTKKRTPEAVRYQERSDGILLRKHGPANILSLEFFPQESQQSALLFIPHKRVFIGFPIAY